MKSTILATLLLVGRLASAHAIDLELPRPAPEPHGMRLSLSTAKVVRTAGVALTLTGLAVNVFGAVALFKRIPGIGYDQGTIGGATAFALGGISFGVGVGLWSYGDLEARRAEGMAPMLTAEHRRARGHSLKATGAVLTALGAVLAVTSFIPLATTHCTSGDGDLCGLVEGIESAVLGGTSSVMLGIGIPLLAVGVSEEHKGAIFTVDRIAPKAMPGGGGIGFSGRF